MDEPVSDQLGRRREASMRLPALPDGRRDPDLEPAWHVCHICRLRSRYLQLVFGHYMCRDRVSCYQRWKGQIA